MTYQERERKRLISQRDQLFRDPGGGEFARKPREFVLADARANLWPGIREDARDYFIRNDIPWWKAVDEQPTGHLLSSQVACVNHLYALRQRRELATAVLQNIDPAITAAEIVDDGYIEFEFIGEKPYLKEKSFTRGTQCTSVDAFMIGSDATGKRRAFLIEWKYTELYKTEDKYIPRRAAIYDPLILATDSPFLRAEPRALYFEPFYQMMRQTLLGYMIAKNGDHHCTSYRHVHVAPDENFDFHRRITAPLEGETVGEAWRKVLKNPEFYVSITPKAFLDPIAKLPDTRSLITYLQRRYWSGA